MDASGRAYYTYQEVKESLLIERAISTKTWRIIRRQLLLSTMGKGERKNVLSIETRRYKDQEVNEDMTCSRDSGATVCMCQGIECDKEARRYKAGELSRHQKMRLS